MTSTVSVICGVAIMVGKFSPHGIDLPLGQVGRGLQVQAFEATIHNTTSEKQEKIGPDRGTANGSGMFRLAPNITNTFILLWISFRNGTSLIMIIIQIWVLPQMVCPPRMVDSMQTEECKPIHNSLSKVSPATSTSVEVCSICGSCCMTIEETSRTAAGVLVLH